MAVLKCKMCGGALELGGESVAVCEYCGTRQTLPKTNDEALTNLYNRANNLRLKCEFDRALSVYEKIVEQDNEQAEAHWGIVLCKYGIEYVEDSRNGNRVPTCHRTLFEAITADADYEAAIDYADVVQQELYKSEARAIDCIQKDILAIVQNEKPFDVFLCYKENDFDGKRTQDSVIANDIYHQLTQEGLKVFYAAITLEDKLGQEYEPYIFAALHSAKVMLVIGTKPEYFDAVWVRNEWSRFLHLAKDDRKKLLIPCYRDMDAYDLPGEFAHLQAQDMSKIGFINDVVRGIKKVISSPTVAPQPTPEPIVAQPNTNTEPLLKRAFLFLEDGDWRRAEDFCEQVLNMDPECAEAYLCKLMLELHVRKREQLGEYDTPFDELGNYQKALRFADDSLKCDLIGYIDQIKTRQETARIESAYQQAMKTMSTAKTEASYKAAADLFETIRNYEDSDALANECYEKAEIARIEAEKRKKRNKKIAIITTPIVCAIIAFIVLFITVIVPMLKENIFIATYGQETYDKFGLVEKGVYLTFGAYEQDNITANGKEDIEWLVLDVKDGKALVISKYALDCRPYNTYYEDVTWETCTLRKWLNNDFINTAFSGDEKAMIPTVTVPAGRNTKFMDTNPGNATQDQVFLLSIIEVYEYFASDSARQCKPTDYAIANGAHSSVVNCDWWLRSPGDYQHSATPVYRDGDIYIYGFPVDYAYPVRPALWIDLNA